MTPPLKFTRATEKVYVCASAVIEGEITSIVAERPEPQPLTSESTFLKHRRPEDMDLASASDLDRSFDLIRMLDG